MWSKIKRAILKDPLSTKAISHERLTNPQGLAIFSADPISSTTYATEEILLVLAAVGTAASYISIPMALAIVCLILIVVISYRQVIKAYPQGGGVYNVAKKNLGEFPALLGAASLMVDYILTVAVSVTAAVAALTSAFEEFLPYRVVIGIAIIIFLAWGNLRGTRESGRMFSLPTYAFIVVFLGMIGYGFWRYAAGTFPVISYGESVQPQMINAIGIFLILRAFASGCTALTGIEATSNGVQAFKPPEGENAQKTMLRMGLILGSIFLGITFLASWAHVQPMEGETVVSQIARALFGKTAPYFIIQASTLSILFLAANTPFADFPRVASQLARDGYFPQQFLNLGSRLVFANGIIVLAVMSAFLLFVFGGRVHALIPLYAVGVFLGFSLSQFGMIRHWKRIGGHKRNIAINALGCFATTIVFLIVLSTKFIHGAWFLIPAIASIIFFMTKVKRHYARVEAIFSLDNTAIPRIASKKTIVVLVSNVGISSYAIQHAKSLRPVSLMAFHVAIDNEGAEKIRQEWEKSFPDIKLTVFISEYRDLISPVLGFLKSIEDLWRDDSVMVLIPEFIPKKFWHRFLHNQTGLRIRLAIEGAKDMNIEILELPVKESMLLWDDSPTIKLIEDMHK